MECMAPLPPAQLIEVESISVSCMLVMAIKRKVINKVIQSLLPSTETGMVNGGCCLFLAMFSMHIWAPSLDRKSCKTITRS